MGFSIYRIDCKLISPNIVIIFNLYTIWKKKERKRRIELKLRKHIFEKILLCGLDQICRQLLKKFWLRGNRRIEIHHDFNILQTDFWGFILDVFRLWVSEYFRLEIVVGRGLLAWIKPSRGTSITKKVINKIVYQDWRYIKTIVMEFLKTVEVRLKKSGNFTHFFMKSF